MRRPLALLTALLLSAAAGLAACDTVTPEQPGTLVVEAFLRAGAPLDTVTLRQTTRLEADGAAPAEGATVRLRLGGRTVRYQPSGVPGRYVPEEPVTADPRTPFALAAVWQDQRATAEGRLPPPIRLDTAVVRASDAPVETVLLDSLDLDSLGVPAGQGYIYPVEVDLEWTTDFPEVGADSSYWVHARLLPSSPPFSSTVIDFFLQPEEVFRERTAERAGAGGRRRWSGVYAVPVDSATAPLPAHRLRVGLVRSDSSYARFIQSRDAPDRREPISNVEGALGIAAGISLDERTLSIGE